MSADRPTVTYHSQAALTRAYARREGVDAMLPRWLLDREQRAAPQRRRSDAVPETTVRESAPCDS
jgi:hypothetical protein